jgi:hypothetical protein
MRKPSLILLTFLLCTLLLTGCACQHQWAAATCTEASRCTQCGTVEGQALGHSWKEADCIHAKTCTRCALAEGKAPGHNWLEANCTSARTCSVCAATEGEPLGHTWEGEATLYSAPVCSVCGAAGEPITGYLAQNGLAVNIRPELAADYITNTYVRPDLDTTGKFLASEVQIFESDATHRAKTGYEWRRVDITVVFRDNHAGFYGANVNFARADYYHDQELHPAGKQDRFSVMHNDKEYRCVITYENAGFSYYDNSNVYRVTCYAQVPVGYDGVVLAFCHGSTDIDGRHLHEVDDENLLLCRLA